VIVVHGLLGEGVCADVPAAIDPLELQRLELLA
jgi:hypothetical protein